MSQNVFFLFWSLLCVLFYHLAHSFSFSIDLRNDRQFEEVIATDEKLLSNKLTERHRVGNGKKKKKRKKSLWFIFLFYILLFCGWYGLGKWYSKCHLLCDDDMTKAMNRYIFPDGRFFSMESVDNFVWETHLDVWVYRDCLSMGFYRHVTHQSGITLLLY